MKSNHINTYYKINVLLLVEVHMIEIWIKKNWIQKKINEWNDT